VYGFHHHVASLKLRSVVLATFGFLSQRSLASAVRSSTSSAFVDRPGGGESGPMRAFVGPGSNGKVRAFPDISTRRMEIETLRTLSDYRKRALTDLSHTRYKLFRAVYKLSRVVAARTN
jgi:hypothetical protein